MSVRPEVQVCFGEVWIEANRLLELPYGAIPVLSLGFK